MKAILSDIHGNLPALEAVLEDIASKDISEIVCLGDVIGYGPWPGECLDRVRNCDTLILGNHEEAVISEEAAKNFNARARRAVDWTRKQLATAGNGVTPEQAKWRTDFIRSFLKGTNVEGILYVHASPRSPTREYINPRDVANRKKMKEIFATLEWVCFVGHTHVPGVFTETEFLVPETDLAIQKGVYVLDPDEKALINVGSVGQPRDGNPEACYAMFDGEIVRWIRVPYDVEKTVQKILRTDGLDDFLGVRLRTGR